MFTATRKRMSSASNDATTATKKLNYGYNKEKSVTASPASTTPSVHDEKLALLMLQRLLHALENNKPFEESSSQSSTSNATSILMRADQARALLNQIHPAERTRALEKRVEALCLKAEQEAKRSSNMQQQQQGNSDDPVQRIFYSPKPQQHSVQEATANGNIYEDDDGDEHVVGVPTRASSASATAVPVSSSSPPQPPPSSSSNQVQELQQEQRQQMEEAISNMASHLKSQTAKIHQTLQTQTAHLTDMEEIAESNVEQVTEIAKDVKEHVSKGWRRTIGTWTMLFTIAGTFIAMLMVIVMVPKPQLQHHEGGGVSLLLATLHDATRARLDSLMLQLQQAVDERTSDARTTTTVTTEPYSSVQEDNTNNNNCEQVDMNGECVQSVDSSLLGAAKQGGDAQKAEVVDSISTSYDDDPSGDNVPENDEDTSTFSDDYATTNGGDEEEAYEDTLEEEEETTSEVEKPSEEGESHFDNDDLIIIPPENEVDDVLREYMENYHASIEQDELLNDNRNVGSTDGPPPRNEEEDEAVNTRDAGDGDGDGDIVPEPKTEEQVDDDFLIEIPKPEDILREYMENYHSVMGEESEGGRGTDTAGDASAKQGDYFDAVAAGAKGADDKSASANDDDSGANAKDAVAAEQKSDVLLERMQNHQAAVQPEAPGRTSMEDSKDGASSQGADDSSAKVEKAEKEHQRIPPTVKSKDNGNTNNKPVSNGIPIFNGRPFSSKDIRRVAASNEVTLLEGYLSAMPIWVDKADKNGWTGLHLAARAGHVAAVQALLNFNANVQIRTVKGETALDIVAHRVGYDHPVARLLQSAAASAGGGDNPHQQQEQKQQQQQQQRAQTPPFALLEIQMAAAQNNVPQLRQMLAVKPEMVNQQDENMWSALHIAASAGHFEVARALLEAGADASFVTNSGQTARQLAVEYFGDGHPIVALL